MTFEIPPICMSWQFVANESFQGSKKFIAPLGFLMKRKVAKRCLDQSHFFHLSKTSWWTSLAYNVGKRLWSECEFHELSRGKLLNVFVEIFSFYGTIINKSDNIVCKIRRQTSHNFKNEIDHLWKWSPISEICKRFCLNLILLNHQYYWYLNR